MSDDSTMLSVPTFSQAGGGARVGRAVAVGSAAAGAAEEEGYSAAALLCTAAGALAAGAMVAYTYARKRALVRDSPKAPAGDLAAYWESLLAQHEAKVQRKRIAAASSSSASSSAAAPSSSSSASSSSSSAASACAGSIDVSSLIYRRPVLSDLEGVVDAMVESFDRFNASAGLPSEFGEGPDGRAHALEVLATCIAHEEGIVVLEPACAADGSGKEGRVLGSAFNDEADIARGAVGCGPWTTRWGVQLAGIGRAMLVRLVSRSIRHGAKSLRLIQISANNTSMALYTSLGFMVREPLMAWKGLLRPPFIERALQVGAEAGFVSRRITAADVPTCDAMHVDCNGVSRAASLTSALVNAPEESMLLVTNSKGNICAYIAGLTSMSYSIATSDDALFFLLASAHAAHAAAGHTASPYHHTSLRLYPQLTRWLLEGGMRAVRQTNLMVLGEWQPIQHDKYVYCPNIMY